jgi:diaminohydroxyphosphoribosylaminopyrimidine deaminase/5-amino-6-(5-phosphoribosylamino)uracil reductase
MREALRLAARARGKTAPNPLVGCVIVRGGRVLAGGYHHRAGDAHAEVDALSKLRGRAPGATVYVTLEPCNHHGRTGPCTEALIAAGVARVIAGMRDPNPAVAGRGLYKLRRAGITVESGLLEGECRALNEAWIHWVTTGRPLVTLKAAVTLDGRIAAHGGDSRWVTGEPARKEAHRLRASHDAILVGARTVDSDDPQLTTRGVRGRDPLRVVLDGKLRISARARALPALVLTTRDAPARPDLERRGCEIVRLRGRGGRIELVAALEALGKRGIQSLLVEGGGEVHGQLLRERLADHAALFVAPKLIGSRGVPVAVAEGPAEMSKAWKLQAVSYRRLGDDMLVRGSFVW